MTASECVRVFPFPAGGCPNQQRPNSAVAVQGDFCSAPDAAAQDLIQKTLTAAPTIRLH